jgi:hypothetical protein
MQASVCPGRERTCQLLCRQPSASLGIGAAHEREAYGLAHLYESRKIAA